MTVHYSPEEHSYDTEALFTVPNVLSFLRLLGVPIFLILVLVYRSNSADIGAALILVIASLTDLFDGRIARATHTVSKLGQMLDPIADRLYIISIVVALGIRGFLTWCFVAILLGRDVMIACLVPLLRRRGYTSLPVHFIGKCATFFLLSALPLILIGYTSMPGALVFSIVGWAAALWGTGMYWWAGLLYVQQTFEILRTPRELIEAT